MMDNDNDLFAEYPHAPGHRGVDTSIAAAEALRPKLGRLQTLVLGAIRNAGEFGLTADECCDVLEQDRWTVQPRTSELRLRRLIADSGRRRKNKTGKSAIVWVAVEHMDVEPVRIAA
jgi:hypothetical protein